MALTVALAADHGGFLLKQQLGPWLAGRGFAIVDLGANVHDPSDDYPDFAAAAARAVVDGAAERAIIVCGSGVGACVVANKVPGARACLCHEIYSAHQGVEDDNMNIICLGARVVGLELAKELVLSFLKAEFTGDERHLRRLEKVGQVEAVGARCTCRGPGVRSREPLARP